MLFTVIMEETLLSDTDQEVTLTLWLIFDDRVTFFLRWGTPLYGIYRYARSQNACMFFYMFGHIVGYRFWPVCTQQGMWFLRCSLELGALF